MIEEAARALLLADGGFALLAGTRVYPGVLPANPIFPACTYQAISATRDYHMRGASSLTTLRMQFDLYAMSAMEAQALKRAFVKAVSGYSGKVETMPPVTIYGAFVVMEYDAFEEGLERAGPRVWRKTLDVEFSFKEVL